MNRLITAVRELDIKEIVLLLIIVSAPIANEKGLATIEFGFTILPSYLFILAGIVFLIRDQLKGRTIGFPLDSVDKSLALFILVIALSISQSRFTGNITNLPMSSAVSVFTRHPFTRSASQVAAIVFMALLYYFVVNVITDIKRLKRAIAAVIITGLLFSGYGLLSFLLVKAGKMNIINFLGNLAGGMPPVYVFIDRGPRVMALFTEPLIFSAYLISVIPVTFIGLFLVRRFRFKAIIGFILIVNISALFLTLSRGACLALLLVLFTLLLVYSGKNQRKIAGRFMVWFIVAALCALLFANRQSGNAVAQAKESRFAHRIQELTIGQLKPVMNLRSYVETSRLLCVNPAAKGPVTITPLEWSTMMRINDMAAGLKMAGAHPVLGVGWGNYIYNYLDYDPRLMGWWWVKNSKTDNRPGTPICPNLFISVLAESGITGLCFFIVFIAALMRFCFKSMSINRHSACGLITGSYLAALVGVIMCYQFFSTFYFTFVWLAFGIAAASARLCVTEQAVKGSAVS